MRQYKHGSPVTVYLSDELLVALEQFTKEFNCSRSSAIEEAVDKFLKSFPMEEDEEGR